MLQTLQFNAFEVYQKDGNSFLALKNYPQAYTLVFFSGNNCKFCVQMKEIIEQSMSTFLHKIHFVTINLSENKNVVQMSEKTIMMDGSDGSIQHVPFIVMYYNNLPIKRFIGNYTVNEFTTFLNGVLDVAQDIPPPIRNSVTFQPPQLASSYAPQTNAAFGASAAASAAATAAASPFSYDQQPSVRQMGQMQANERVDIVNRQRSSAPNYISSPYASQASPHASAQASPYSSAHASSFPQQPAQYQQYQQPPQQYNQPSYGRAPQAPQAQRSAPTAEQQTKNFIGNNQFHYATFGDAYKVEN